MSDSIRARRSASDGVQGSPACPAAGPSSASSWRRWRAPALVADGVAGGHDQADRGDLAAPAAGAVPAGGRVEVGPLEHEPLELAVLTDRALGEPLGRGGQGGGELEALLQGLEHLGVLLQRGQGAGSADLDALQAAGALPRVDGRREQPAGAGAWPSPSRRRTAGCGPRGRSPARRPAGRGCARSVGWSTSSDGHGRGDQRRWNGAVGLVRAVGLADLLGQRVHLPAQGLALRLGDVEVLDRGEQQVVDLVHRVRDRGVGADQGALHAAGAQRRRGTPARCAGTGPCPCRRRCRPA